MLELVRGGIALFALIVLVYWTQRRVRGAGDDPTLRLSKATETGSSSFLVTGLDAVAIVAVVMSLALWPELQANPWLGVIPVALVAAHFIVEKEERA